MKYLDDISILEDACFPEDEAASKERIKYRIENASDYFYCAFRKSDNKLIGFVNGTLARGSKLEHETMANHDPKGESLCIHSVTVDPSLRRQNLGSWEMKHYLRSITEKQPNVKLILLLCKAHLISFYKACGFSLVGESDVVHGKEKWYEMKFIP